MPGWTLVSGLLVALCLVPAVVTLELKHLGERALQTELDLAMVEAEVHSQNGVEWQAISGDLSPGEAAEQIQASAARSRDLLRARRIHPDRGTAALLALQDRYAAAVQAELGQLEQGHRARALELDESIVDPTFQAMLRTVAEQRHGAHTTARRAGRLSDLGILATVVVSLLVMSVLQGRRRFRMGRQIARRQTEARFRALVDRSSDLIIVASRDGQISYLSPSAERLVGSPATPGSRPLTDVVHEQDRDLLRQMIDTAGEQSPSIEEVRIGAQGQWRRFDLSIRDLSADPDVAGLVLTGHDITDRHALEQELKQRALHDPLTGLPNRTMLADRFHEALASDEPTGPEQTGPRSPAGLLLIDLDRFKEINDSLGHHYGDELLKLVGPRIQGAVRPIDVVARLGGDEFAVLLPAIADLDAALELAAAVRQAVFAGFTVDEITLDVEASIGVVVSGIHGDNPDTLLQRADIAMYVAKQTGTGVAAYDAVNDTHSPQRLALLADLRRALGTDQLYLQFQPQVSLGSGAVVGAEALLRWNHPDRGLIFPDTFIPLAEHTGLIGPLTLHVLDRALTQIASWRNAGHPIPVAVNLSARNLLDDALPDQLARLLSQYDVPAGLLHLEVTESAIMTDPDKALRLLDELRRMGLTIAIDDFGAGYTSLAQLKNLPVGQLKIDKSFVMTMHADPANALIVRSVIELGHNLGLTAVAEGVENSEAMELLSALGCDFAQGYHIARPADPEDFLHWYTEKTATRPDSPTVAAPKPRDGRGDRIAQPDRLRPGGALPDGT